MSIDQEKRVKRAHITLMKHQDTALYSGVMLMGDTEVVDGKFTAYTDGVNKRYCRQYIAGIESEPKLRGLVLHENLHVGLKQLPRGKDLWAEDSKLANVSADLVVNDIIVNITAVLDTTTNQRLVELPDGGLHDPKFSNWSMREIYNELKKQNPQRRKPKPQDGGSKGDDNGGDPNPSEGGEPVDSDDDVININGKEVRLSDHEIDEHDTSSTKELTNEQIKELGDRIDKALREGGILAGRMGGGMPRVISESLEPSVDWVEEMNQYVTSYMRGNEELTWRKMNRRHLADDMYLPSVENEAVGEIIYAVDTSGSISNEDLSRVAGELASLCELCNPERVRVLWWDTKVHGEQVFDGDYGNIATMLKPQGGGGTHVSSVSDYIIKNDITAECMIVHTDGYVENNIKWDTTIPTLWLVTMNRQFTPPSGKKVMID